MIHVLVVVEKNIKIVMVVCNTQDFLEYFAENQLGGLKHGKL
jgi:hypothetical protein